MNDPAAMVAALSGSDPASKLEAARWLAEEACRESSKIREVWIAEPAVAAALVATLADPDAAIAENALIALAEISRRYKCDPAGFPAVLPLLRSKRQLTRRWAVMAAALLGGEKSLDAVLSLFRDRAAGVRDSAVSAAHRLVTEGLLTSDSRDRFQRAAVPLLTDPDFEVRGRAANLLRDLGARPDLRELQQALDAETNPHTRTSLQQAIVAIRGRK